MNNKKKYNITKDDLINYIELGLTQKEIADIYGCSITTITLGLKKYNLHTSNIKDLTGQKFGRLTVIKMNEKRNTDGHVMWDCICSCGNEKTFISHSLISGASKSCGCLRNDISTKHGMYRTRIYHIYKGIRDRCLNPNRHEYQYYGGRGITICDEWLDEQTGFMNFYNWSINNGYNDDLEIDRKNNDGNYEPDNCRWVNHITQMNNTRRNVYIEHNRKIKSVAQWSKEIGLPETTIRQRMVKTNDSNKILKKEAW